MGRAAGWTGAVLVAVILTLVGVGWRPGPVGAAAETLHLGYSTWVGYGPLFLARDYRYFDEAGVNVELTNIEDPKLRFAALAAGKLDGLVTTLDTMSLYWKPTLQFQAVLGLDDSKGGGGLSRREGGRGGDVGAVAEPGQAGPRRPHPDRQQRDAGAHRGRVGDSPGRHQGPPWGGAGGRARLVSGRAVLDAAPRRRRRGHGEGRGRVAQGRQDVQGDAGGGAVLRRGDQQAVHGSRGTAVHDRPERHRHLDVAWQDHGEGSGGGPDRPRIRPVR